MCLGCGHTHTSYSNNHKFQGPIKENEDKYYYELYYTLKKGQLKITNLLKR